MKGMLFKDEMRAAVAAGTKTQTRRLGGLQLLNKEPDLWTCDGILDATGAWRFIAEGRDAVFVKPKYRTGETVYIKEPYAIDSGGLHYYGKDKWEAIKPNELEWRNAMFMPEESAHYKVQITSNYCERLCGISVGDCLAEGIQLAGRDTGDAVTAYRKLWDSINPKIPWSFNPWVWKYGLELLPA